MQRMTGARQMPPMKADSGLDSLKVDKGSEALIAFRQAGTVYSRVYREIPAVFRPSRIVLLAQKKRLSRDCATACKLILTAAGTALPWDRLHLYLLSHDVSRAIWRQAPAKFTAFAHSENRGYAANFLNSRGFYLKKAAMSEGMQLIRSPFPGSCQLPIQEFPRCPWKQRGAGIQRRRGHWQ